MGKVIIHPGQMKSGTTFIQSILNNNRSKLLEQNVLYPGNRKNHKHACYGIAGSFIPWVKTSSDYKKYADNLIRDIELYRNSFDILISSEALASMPEEGVASFIDSIGGADVAIFTFRNLCRTLPSAWQQTLKKGNSESINHFFERLCNDRDKKTGPWKTYCYSENVKVWSKFVDVKCIMLPENSKDHRLPWTLFSEAAGVSDPADFTVSEDRKNSSFSMESAQLLRAIARLAKESGENPKNLCLMYYNKFILGSERVGQDILPPNQFKVLLQGWDFDEWQRLLNLDVELYGAQESPEYQGKWLENAKNYDSLSLSAIQSATNFINFLHKQ